MDLNGCFRLIVAPIVMKFGSNDARANMALALGKTKSRYAVRFLVSALKDENSVVRFQAADALAEIGDRRALQPLEAVYNDKGEDLVVLTSALHALRVLEPARYGSPYVYVKAKH